MYVFVFHHFIIYFSFLKLSSFLFHLNLIFMISWLTFNQTWCIHFSWWFMFLFLHVTVSLQIDTSVLKSNIELYQTIFLKGDLKNTSFKYILWYSVRRANTYLMDDMKCSRKKSDSKKDVNDNQPNPKICWKSHPISTKPNRTKSNEAKIECIATI